MPYVEDIFDFHVEAVMVITVLSSASLRHPETPELSE